MENKEICKAKHTKYQPSQEEWKCPTCGEDNKHFIVEESDEKSEDGCDMIHEDDWIICDNCGYGESGFTTANKIRKINNHKLVKCECCKGYGYIKVKKEK